MFSYCGDLASLLHPVPVSVFFSDYWGKKPLYIRREDSDYYKGLYTSDDIDDCLRFMAPLNEWDEKIKMAIKFKLVSSEALFDRNLPGFDYRMIRRSQQAVSLIMNHIQCHNNRIYRMTRILEQDLQGFIKGRVNVNAYFSPGNTYINPHVDAHDELNIQVEGSKRWRVYEPLFTNPCEIKHLDKDVVQKSRSSALDDREPYMEVVLHPGDFLYMPRGFRHDPVNSANEPSLGLTIGVHPICWLDMIGFAAKISAEKHGLLRESVPVALSSDTRNRKTIWNNIQTCISKMNEEASLDEMIAMLQRDFPIDDIHTNDLYIPPFEDLETLKPHTLLNRPKDVSWTFQQIYGLLRLKVDGREIGLRLETKEALEFIRNCNETFTPSDLPGNMTAQDKTHLCRFLLNFGAIQFAVSIIFSRAVQNEQPVCV